MDTDPAGILRSLMQSVCIPSYRALAVKASVSRWQIQQLRSGNLSNMRIATLTQIAQALDVSLAVLIQKFLNPTNPESLELPESPESNETPQYQSAALQTLETWLVQWPTIAKRAQDNPALAAAKILPFVRPVEQLMQAWNVEPIAAVDEQIAYDPQYHQLVKGLAEPGDLVQVTHTGQLHQGNLLHRAKVKSIEP